MSCSTKRVLVEKMSGDGGFSETDQLAVEEPLEIRLGFREKDEYIHKPISITMRTPGDDFELAAGFLFTEGIVSEFKHIAKIKHCGPPKEAGAKNTVRVDLSRDVELDLKILERHFYTTSSCGVCGKSSIEALSYGLEKAKISTADTGFGLSAEVIHALPDRISQNQRIFEQTGGLHASALFDSLGAIETVFEDVGRHNALDKVIGLKFLKGETPLTGYALFLSGRISFELVQKALIAGIRVIVAVGSPSSLAVELAKEYGMTLVGFARDKRFNVYTGKQRIT